MEGAFMITVNGDKMEWKEGMTVRGLLQQKKWTYPLIAVWIDDVPVPPEQFDVVEIPDSSTVQVVHMVAGG
jgi:sulfur carrier protein